MKLFLTIGVSEAPPLSHLPGAITVAREMGDWARKSGFVTKVITDENKTPVTIARIRETLLGMLSTNDEVELFILHFAGHGFRSGAEQNVWLPSDWHKEMRAISVEGLKRQLYRHGIKSLSIFGDACRSLPTDIDTADIFGDPVLPRGPYDAVAPIIDRINAVGDGQQAYMLKGDGVAPPRCVFSTVLVEGLCGLKDEAFDKHNPDCVIPESLALFSRDRLKEIGETYDLKCSPDYATGIPREHAIYFRRGENPADLPIPQWPAPPCPLVHAPDNTGEDLQASPPDIEFRAFKRHFRDSLSLHSYLAPWSINLAIRGAVPKKIWSTSPVEKSLIDADGTAYRVRGTADGAIQILVEFDDGVFASAVVYENLITLISRDEKGEINWTCISEFPEFGRGLRTSINVIADLQAGNLSADQVDDIAAKLREAKHINPTLGAIASYLYDYTGDIDSIRRMAFFYCFYAQPMPFDVAFMGLLSTKEGQDGIVADVPPIPARPQSLANSRLPGWVTRATDGGVGQVAGLWPWLRQGWQFMEDPAPQEKAAAEGLRDVAKFLLPSQFSSFKEQGAGILIDRFNLEASE
ncbi:caspase family protein [Pseudomonas citronellolis]|uniref:caspase family protein n=1 Tax=Pseudomonas citronellolis TaxID=53408 RepID=UPI0009F25501|nr:caspase family protein [Pseudomonas humi]